MEACLQVEWAVWARCDQSPRTLTSKRYILTSNFFAFYFPSAIFHIPFNCIGSRVFLVLSLLRLL